jgi:ABC-type Fe3+ transport system permease subunit
LKRFRFNINAFSASKDSKMKMLFSVISAISTIVMAISYIFIFLGILQFLVTLYFQPIRYVRTLIESAYLVVFMSIVAYVLKIVVKLINKHLESSK